MCTPLPSYKSLLSNKLQSNYTRMTSLVIESKRNPDGPLRPPTARMRMGWHDVGIAPPSSTHDPLLETFKTEANIRLASRTQVILGAVPAPIFTFTFGSIGDFLLADVYTRGGHAVKGAVEVQMSVFGLYDLRCTGRILSEVDVCVASGGAATRTFGSIISDTWTYKLGYMHRRPPGVNAHFFDHILGSENEARLASGDRGLCHVTSDHVGDFMHRVIASLPGLIRPSHPPAWQHRTSGSNWCLCDSRPTFVCG
ncbi:hypothetical protein V8D89_000412 [Ganoderma adspersum]